MCSNEVLLFWCFAMGQHWIFIVRNISEEAAGKGSPTDTSMMWKHTFSHSILSLYYSHSNTVRVLLACSILTWHRKATLALSFSSQLRLEISVDAARCCTKHRRTIPCPLDFTPLGRRVSYFRILDTSSKNIYLSLPFCSLDKEEKHVTESWDKWECTSGQEKPRKWLCWQLMQWDP